MTKIEVALAEAREGDWIEAHMAGSPERDFCGTAYRSPRYGLTVGYNSVRRIDGTPATLFTVTRITREVPDLPTDPEQYFTATVLGQEGVLLRGNGPDAYFPYLSMGNSADEHYPYLSMGNEFSAEEIDPTTVQLVDIVPR